MRYPQYPTCSRCILTLDQKGRSTRGVTLAAEREVCPMSPIQSPMNILVCDMVGALGTFIMPQVVQWYRGSLPTAGYGMCGGQIRVRLGIRAEPPYSHRLLHDLGVNPGHPIHSVGPDHAQVCHVDSLAVPFLNHRHPPQAVHIPRKQGGHVLKPRTQR